MKCLTVDPDWAMLILNGEKTVEFRTWKTSYRGDVVICSSAKKIRHCISGHALVVANLVNIEPFSKEHLDAAAMDFYPDESGYAWIFNNFRLIKPIPVKGKLRLFDYDISPEIIPDDISENEAEAIVKQYFEPLIN